jgi:hypothetical protein
MYSRTRILLAGPKAHGLGFYEKPIWPSPWARAHGPMIATTAHGILWPLFKRRRRGGLWAV